MDEMGTVHKFALNDRALEYMNVLWEAENIDHPVPEGRLRPNTNNGVVASNGRIVAAMSDRGERSLTLFDLDGSENTGTTVDISPSHPNVQLFFFTGSGRYLVGMNEDANSVFAVDVGQGGIDKIGDLRTYSLLKNAEEEDARVTIRGFLVKDDVVFASFLHGGGLRYARIDVTAGQVSTAISWDDAIWKALVHY